MELCDLVFQGNLLEGPYINLPYMIMHITDAIIKLLDQKMSMQYAVERCQNAFVWGVGYSYNVIRREVLGFCVLWYWSWV